MSRKQIVIFIASACVLVSACGSRVAPLAGSAVGNQPGAQIPGPVPTGGFSVNPTTGATTGPGGAILPPPTVTRADCKGGATDTGVTASTIKLGLVASLTGPLPGQFNSAVEATDAYFRAINDAGGICGRRVQLLIRDDNGSGGTDYQVARKLAKEDKVFAFVGSVSAPDDSGIEKVTKEFKIPDIGFPLTWARTESPYNFSVPGAVQHEVTGEGASGTKWLNETYDIKQVAIFWLRESEVSVLSAWGFEAADVKAKLSADGKTSGVRICHEQPSGVLDSNYTNYVLAMEGDCDPKNGNIAVYTTMENNGNIKLAKAMKEQGFHPTVFAPTFTSYLPTFISEAGGSTEGAFIALPQVPLERLSAPQNTWTPGTYELQRYISTLYRYYPRPSPPGSFGAPGWGSADLFAQVAAKCGAALTRTCLLDGLRSWPPYTANGFLTPNRPGDHTIYHADLLVQVRNGKFVEIHPERKDGPAGAPDFWDDSKLFDWGKFMCDHPALFPNMTSKRQLLRAC